MQKNRFDAAALLEYELATKAVMRTGFKLDYALSNELMALFLLFRLYEPVT